jgi:protein SCO1/2
MNRIAFWLRLPALLAVLLYYNAAPLLAASQKPLEVGITERLDQFIPGGVILTDSKGKQVDLKKLIDKPTVLNFVYFRCPGICSPLMNGLSEVINNTDMVLGKEYQVITISFDSRESYELADKKRVNYLKKMVHKSDSAGWIFLTGDSLNIQRITQSTGFGFKLVGNEFMHEGALIMISPKGKITRYLKGISFLPFEFKLAILEASEGKSGATISKVLQFCYSYDAASQHYVMDITKVSATIILFFALTLLIYLLVKSRRKKAVKKV